MAQLVASQTAIARNTALASNSFVMEAGSIFPAAVEQAQKEGRELTGADLARVWGTSVVAAGVDALTDKLGLDTALGKFRIGRQLGRVGGAVTTGLGLAAIEGGTEVAQTALERLGAGRSLTDEEARRDYLNSGAMVWFSWRAIEGRPTCQVRNVLRTGTRGRANYSR